MLGYYETNPWRPTAVAWNGVCNCPAHHGLHPAHLSASTSFVTWRGNSGYKPRHLRED